MSVIMTIGVFETVTFSATHSAVEHRPLTATDAASIQIFLACPAGMPSGYMFCC